LGCSRNIALPFRSILSSRPPRHNFKAVSPTYPRPTGPQRVG
jgi:hypothetical protein